MYNVNYEKIEQIVKLAVDTSVSDYLIQALPSIVAIVSLLLSGYIYKQQSKKNIAESIVRDDIARLYEAADNFFEFSDAASAFFSYKKYEYKRLIKDQEIDKEFLAHIRAKNEKLQDSFSNVHRAAFMLSSLGNDDLAEKLVLHHDEIVDLRAKIFEFEQSDEDKVSIEEFTVLISARKNKFAEEKKQYTKSILAYKTELIGKTKL